MLVVFIILVMMVLLFWIGGRIYEIGILLVIGKFKVIIIVSM